MVDLYEEFNLTKKEVLAWAEEHYPQFIANESLMAQLFLRQKKGIDLKPQQLQLLYGQEKTVSELETGKRVLLTVVVGLEMRRSQYVGCPTCMSKTENDFCNKCGQNVEAITHNWVNYVIGDTSGEVVGSFPPRISNEHQELMGQVVRISGFLQDDGTFNVNGVKILENGIAPALVTKKVAVVEDGVTTKIKQFLDLFPQAAEKEFLQWYQQSGFKPDVEEALKQAGYQLKDGTIALIDNGESTEDTPVPEPKVKVAPKPGPKAKPVEKPVITDETVKKDLEQFQGVLNIFESITLEDLQGWHAQTGATTPLEELIKAAGCKVVEGKVIRQL